MQLAFTIVLRRRPWTSVVQHDDILAVCTITKIPILMSDIALTRV